MRKDSLKQYQGIFSEIKEAYNVVHEIAHYTPFVRSNTFSIMTGGEVYLKLECLQRTGSFKVRGAYYAISKLKDEVKKKGCVTASAGNHAQGVAYAASSLGIKATVVMPQFSSTAKVQATLGYGGNVLLYGGTLDEAVTKALEICEEKKCVFLHPFDDPRIIAGQGTIGLEMVEAISGLDSIIVPIGGGGLISGVAIAVKSINPTLEIFGVQASGSPSMFTSLKEKSIVGLSAVDTIADGIAVKQPSALTFKIASELVDNIFLVDDDEIAHAIFLLLERAKLVVEPAGAVGLAALLSEKIKIKGRKVGVVISGGNIDMSLLVRIINRSLFKTNRFVTISGLLSDRPGTLKDLLTIIASVKANIISIEHDRTSPHINLGKTNVALTLEVPDKQDIDALKKSLSDAGYNFGIG